MIAQLAIILLGFIVLTRAADDAVKRLVRLSRHFGLTEFAISFAVVGIVSTFPELSIGINSALEGVPSFGLGVIFGSNVADLTLVVGAVALMGGGIRLKHPILQDSIWFILAVGLPVLLLLDGSLSRIDGLLLLGAFLFYLSRLLSRRKSKKAKRVKVSINAMHEFALALVSIAAILISGMVITDAAEQLSAGMGLPILFIGTLLAIGTCLPELMFAITATNHKHSDMGFGDILGNVLADSMGVLGIIAIICPITPEYPQLALLSGMFAFVSMVMVVTFFKFNGAISKSQGLALVLLYIVLLAVQTIAEGIIVSGA